MSEKSQVEYYINRKELELNLDEVNLHIRRLEHQKYLILLDLQSLNSLDSQVVNKEEEPSNIEQPVKRLRVKTDDQLSRNHIEVQE